MQLFGKFPKSHLKQVNNHYPNFLVAFRLLLLADYLRGKTPLVASTGFLTFFLCRSIISEAASIFINNSQLEQINLL